MGTKAMVLSSGGVDSTTALGLAVEKYGAENVISLSARYGQKHVKELEAAAAVAAHYGVEHLEMDLTAIFRWSNSTLLQHSSGEIPEESYAEQIAETGGEKPVSTYVPFRNGLFLSAAAAAALSRDCAVLYYGAHADDAAGAAYPDCSPAFHEAMATAVYEGSGRQLTIEAPFINMTKTEVVRTGLAIGVPYELTWSCYEGGAVPCGKCATCLDRAKAFRENGVLDPALPAQKED
jgi:7-cyano-7-deazaguanine synthase